MSYRECPPLNRESMWAFASEGNRCRPPRHQQCGFGLEFSSFETLGRDTAVCSSVKCGGMNVLHRPLDQLMTFSVCSK